MDAVGSRLPAEEALVERAQSGDIAAYEELVRRYQSLAVRTAYAITRESADAEDAAQDAFIKAFYALPSFQAAAPFRPWLLRIVANEARNRRKAAGRRVNLATRAAERTLSEGYVPSPELSALAIEEHAQLIDAVRQLRAEDRAAIAGRYFLDLSEAEMAQTLGWPRGTVKSRLSRALARLRQGLVIGLVLLLLLAGAALGFSPEARSAIAERLGVNGILIRHIPADPAGPVDPSAGSLPGRTNPPVAPPSSGASPDAQIGAEFEAPHRSAAPSEGIGQHLHLGQQMSLEQARQQVRFTIVQPHLPDLALPGAIYVDVSPPGGQVSLVYAPRSSQSTTLPAGTGETGTRDVGLLFTQFPGRVQQDLVMKFLGPSTRLQAVRVNGSAGYWIEGTPHQFFYVDSMGQVRQETFRLATNTLLWTQGEMTFRLEGAPSQEAALQIAASVG